MSDTARTGSQVDIVEIPLGDARIKDFVKVAWTLNHGDPFWTPPLNADLLGNKALGIVGLLTPEHPYHRTAQVHPLHRLPQRDARGPRLRRDKRRGSTSTTTATTRSSVFECINDQSVADALLDAVKEWAVAKGAHTLRGPGEYSNATHERQACLIEGFDTPPAVELTHNPPYYRELIENYGFTKAMDYVAYFIDLTQPVSERLRKVASEVRAHREIQTRPVDMSRFEDDVRLVVDIYNQAWANNWGFLPITSWEADMLAESLKPIIDPGLCRFAYQDGEPIAVLGCFPDPNVAFRPRWKWYGDSDYVRLARLFATRRKIDRVRLMFFGIVPGHRRGGTDAVLFQEIHDYATTHGYRDCDVSMLLEHNELVIRASAFMGGHEYKKWRIWDLKLQ